MIIHSNFDKMLKISDAKNGNNNSSEKNSEMKLNIYKENNDISSMNIFPLKAKVLDIQNLNTKIKNNKSIDSWNDKFDPNNRFFQLKKINSTAENNIPKKNRLSILSINCKNNNFANI